MAEEKSGALEVKMPPKMSRQLLVLFVRVSLMLALLLVGGCYLVAQPSIRKTSRPYPLPIKGRARTRWTPQISYTRERFITDEPIRKIG